jgi:uncharacterized protein YxeA
MSKMQIIIISMIIMVITSRTIVKNQNGRGKMNETEAPSNGTDDRNVDDDIDNSLNRNIENEDASS